MAVLLEPSLYKFLTQSKHGDEVVFVVYGALVIGIFIKYDPNEKIVEVETTKISDSTVDSRLYILDRMILSWGNPTKR